MAKPKTSTRDNAPDIISDMEPDIRLLGQLADFICAVGASNAEITNEHLHMLGGASTTSGSG